MAKPLRMVDPMGPPPPDRTVPKPGGSVNKGRFSSVPPIWISGIDRVPDVESALFALQIGNFRQAALLSDAVMRDDRIWSVMDTRVGVLRGADVEIKPADDSAKAEKVASLLGGDEEETGIWEDLFPAPLMGQLLQYGMLNGIAVAEIVWLPTQDGVWMPRLVPYHPQFIYWDWGYRCYRLILEDGIISLPDVMANPYSDGKWFVWCPFGYQYAWASAMIRPLADLYLKRRWNGRDWARYNEKHGSPADIVYVPEDAEQEDKDAFFSDIVNRGADTAVMVPRRDGQGAENGYGLDLLEAKARTYDSFNLQQEKIDNSVAILFWGQNLTTEVQKGAGSKAAEQGHQKVADIKTKEDAAIARVARQQLLTWWAHHNFGDAELAPRVRYVTEPPTDEKEIGAGYKALGEGVSALILANPRADADAIFDAHGVPMKTVEQMAEEQRQKDERAAEVAAAAAEAAAKKLPPGQDGGPDGGGGTPAPGDGAPPAAGDKKEPPEKKAAAKNTGAEVVARRRFAGFSIAVENPAGSVRKWHDAAGKQTGETTMYCDYGFFEDHLGADDEELDVYLGPDEAARDVHVVQQMAGPDFKRKDEDKVMLGFPSQDAARAAYAQHRNDGEAAIGAITSMSVERFRKKLRARRGTGHITARAREKTATLRNARAVRLVPNKRKRTKLYSDGVVDRARKTASKAMASSLHRVVTAIKASHSYDDLKKRLLMEFKAMRPEELAKVVEKARIMAKAGGMDSAWQQV